MTVKNSTITGNSSYSDGGGIYSHFHSALTIENSTISDNTSTYGDGGGVFSFNYETLVITDCTISGNSAYSHGGGMVSKRRGSMTMERCTVSGNTADTAGGGVYNEDETIEIKNCTIAGNSSYQGAGIYNNSNTIHVTNSTIADNSGSYGLGIYNRDKVDIKNSIIANVDWGDCDGLAPTSGGYNIESGTTCGLAGTGDLQNTDPKLNSLANGVMVPQSDSPAIDGGNPADPGSSGDACLANDQRGNARDDLRCDMGAVEVQLSDTDTVIKDVSGAGTFTFGPTLVKIEVTNQGGLSQLQVQHHDGDHPDATRMNGQWWGITPTGSGFTANLDLPHMVTPDANAKVCKHVSGSTWDCARDGSTADRVWRNGLTEFSDWAVGDNVGPTAVTLRDFAAGGEPDGLGAILWGGMLAVLAGVGAWLGLRREYDNETETSPAPAPRFGTET